MSVAKIEAHIDAIERKLTKSIKIAEKGASMKLGDVAKLGQKTNSIVSEINKSIKEYDGAEPTADEAQRLLTKMEKVVTLTEKELNIMTTHKARIDELRLGGLVKRNLVKSQDAGVALSNQMRDKAPENLKEAASALEARRMKAFEKAVAVFANSTGGEDQADAADDSD